MKKIVHFYFLLFILLLIFPSTTYAAISITSATLNSASSITVGESSTISAKINVTTTGGTNWRSTSWRIGSSGGYTCIDHTNHDGTGTYNETFNITAPSTAGTYSVSFIASSNNSCGGTTNTTTLSNAITVLPTVSIANVSQAEGNSGTSNMNFTVTLSSSANVTVTYTTSNGTAIAGSDYTATNGTFSFTAGGTTTKTISVPIIGNTLYEPDKTFKITLNSIGTSNSTATATGTIINDDTLPTLSIVNASKTEGNSGTSNMTFTVSLSKSATATVTYATSDGTATAGSDYTATSGTLTFTSGGSTTQTISVPIIGDTNTENNETFTVTLSSTDTSNSTATATGTIIDDDQVSYTCANPKTFTKASSNNINGDVLIVGNTNMCYGVNGTCSDPGSARNNDINMIYSKKSADSTNSAVLNSSSASFQLDSNSTILWAKVYWQGYLVNESTTVKNSARSILFQSPNQSYQTIDSSDFNWVYLASGRFYYQGSADVTSFVKAGGNGYYSVANIVSETGQPTGGSYGGWSLVIVYSNNSKTLKNITVFDGYQGIVTSDDQTSATSYANNNRCSSDTGAKNSMEIPLSGFLTPTAGTVTSSLSVFAGEGDKGATGDHLQLKDTSGAYHYVANTLNPYDDIFNSTITYNGTTVTNSTSPVAITPWYSANSNGIDIDTFDVSTDYKGNTLIGNSQTSTTVKLDTSGDGYMPGVFAFSTELYVPDVCYSETVTYNDLTISNSNTPVVGDNLDYEVSITNKNNEPAKGVYIEKVFGNDGGISYVSNSMNIAPIPGTIYADNNKTDTSGDDTAEFSSDTNTSKFLLGVGASSSSGGTIAYDALTKFKYRTKITNTIINENSYLVSYRNDQLGISFTGIPIRKCTDFNNSIVASAPLGVFNVVNKNFTGSTDPKSTTDSLNALYTQVAGQDFTVKILSLDSDYITLKSYNSDVNLSLISKPNYSVTDTDDQKQAKCDAASSLGTAQTISFASESSKTLTLNYVTAYQDVAFKMAYNDNGIRKYVCSRDSFAIRPATYSLATNSINLIGGKAYTLTAKALTNASATATGYTQSMTTTSADPVATIDLIIPIGCALDNNSTKMTLSFTNGVATNTTFTYNNIGDVNVTVSDNNWTIIDQNSNGDCLVGSTTPTPDANGRVGCLIKKVQPFTFSPKQFNNILMLQDFNNGNFTYISNDSNMSAKALLTTIAVLNDTTTTATNYTAKCYARDIDYTLALINNKTLSNSTTQNRIRYSKDNTKSNLENNATVGQATFSSTEGNFTNGVASNLSMLFNFARDITKADEPFKIAKNDFNITSVVDSNGTTGTDFNRTNDQNTTFYYGRVYSTDYRGPSPIDTTIRYEIYCKNCNKTALGVTGTQSPLSLYWYQNTLHVIADGNVTTFTPQGTTTVNPNATNTITNGFETHTHQLTNNNAPYLDRIAMNPSTWLLYNLSNASATTNDFNVEFITSGSWAGAGNVDRNDNAHTTGAFTNDTNITRSNRKMNW